MRPSTTVDIRISRLVQAEKYARGAAGLPVGSPRHDIAVRVLHGLVLSGLPEADIVQHLDQRGIPIPQGFAGGLPGRLLGTEK